MDFLDKKVRFFWLLPITDEEHSFIQRGGVEELEQLFEQHNINYLDVNRVSVV